MRDRIEKMASDIRRHYKAGELHLVCLLKGAQTFFSALSEFIQEQQSFVTDANCLELIHHYLQISSYRNGAANRQVKLVADELPCLKDKDVLIIDDVVESGNTINYIEAWLSKFKPKSIRKAGLLQVRIKGEMPTVDFVGFSTPIEWFVGYGIDFNDRLREVPHICVLSERGKKALAV